MRIGLNQLNKREGIVAGSAIHSLICAKCGAMSHGILAQLYHPIEERSYVVGYMSMPRAAAESVADSERLFMGRPITFCGPPFGHVSIPAGLRHLTLTIPEDSYYIGVDWMSQPLPIVELGLRRLMLVEGAALLDSLDPALLSLNRKPELGGDLNGD